MIKFNPNYFITHHLYFISILNQTAALNVVYHKKTTIMDDRLSYREKEALPDSMFGLPERREYPMPDAAHVRAAEAYFRYCPEDLRPRLARAILQRAKEFGVDVESPVILGYAKQ